MGGSQMPECRSDLDDNCLSLVLEFENPDVTDLIPKNI